MVLKLRKLVMTRAMEELEGIFVYRQIGRVCEISCGLHYGLCICLNTYIQPFLYFTFLGIIINLFLYYLVLRNFYYIRLFLPFKVL